MYRLGIQVIKYGFELLALHAIQHLLAAKYWMMKGI